ncbi:MAG: hypothetical protein HC883_00900, partial [Bdellovibrionaceae bacterium]|nr:hypothetical protein [Pseudobdellovibrionaceae bacterium]
AIIAEPFRQRFINDFNDSVKASLSQRGVPPGDVPRKRAFNPANCQGDSFRQIHRQRSRNRVWNPSALRRGSSEAEQRSARFWREDAWSEDCAAPIGGKDSSSNVGASGARQSLDKIAAWLNKKEVPTKNRSKRWSRPTVHKILRRASLMTKLRSGDAPRPAASSPIH